MKKQISITLEKEILQKVDNKRGLIDRSTFIENIIKENLK